MMLFPAADAIDDSSIVHVLMLEAAIGAAASSAAVKGSMMRTEQRIQETEWCTGTDVRLPKPEHEMNPETRIAIERGSAQ